MTLKQEKALINLVENGGNASKAMRDAGYSEAMAHNPQKLTQSKAAQALLKPLLKKHGITLDRYVGNIGEAMKAEKTVVYGKGEDAFVDTVPDHSTRLSANKQAERFLFKDTQESTFTPSEVKRLASGSDEVDLYKMVFKKNKEGQE